MQVLNADPAHTIIQFSLLDYHEASVDIEGIAHSDYMIPNESRHCEVGAPGLPRVCRSVVIPADQRMRVVVLDSAYTEHEHVRVAPSRGHFTQAIDPATVPFEFGPSYDVDDWFPGVEAELSEPYIFRDQRGVTVRWHPLQYNPATGRLRIYSHCVVELTPLGPDTINVLPDAPDDRPLSASFEQTFAHHFLNYSSPSDYAPLDESGLMLVICGDGLVDAVAPLLAHRAATGTPTTLTRVSQIPGGNQPAAIKAYIQSRYLAGDLVFVLLVGDAAQVATPSAWGGAGDPTYAQLSGTDPYPDVIVGRLSAENPAELATQVHRIIQHETLEVWTQTWYRRATGIASSQGAGIGDDGESDIEHLERIRSDLLAFGYSTVDQIYDPGATAAAVSAAINQGRGWVNYCGHGTASVWSTTGFSAAHVQALSNQGRLPFILTVACVNGDFAGRTCFAETWMRAQRSGQAIGAVAMYASSIDQYWAPPMAAQDEIIDLLTEQRYATAGALCYAGAARMIDDYGFAGAQMFDTWHYFGDPALKLGTRVPRPPRAENLSLTTFYSTPLDVSLLAIDEGLPASPGVLTYQVVQLPARGALWVNGERVTAAPYTLPPGQRSIRYQPNAGFAGVDTFRYRASDGGVAPSGGWSNEAGVTINVGGRITLYNFNLEFQPGWFTTGQWQYGRPAGRGASDGGFRDPLNGYTGANVFGINLQGDYSTAPGPAHYLTTRPLDLSDGQNTRLSFKRWLNCDAMPFVACTVEISTDGFVWSTIWSNGDDSITDASWRDVQIDIADIADGRPQVFIRWGHQIGDFGAYAYSGWNIDDVQISVEGAFATQRGDVDCSGTIDFQDISAFVTALAGPAVYDSLLPDCDYYLADMNDDARVDFFDIDPFILRISSGP